MTSRTRQSRIASLPLVLALTSHTVADEGRGPLPVAETLGQLSVLPSSPIALSPDGGRSGADAHGSASAADGL